MDYVAIKFVCKNVDDHDKLLFVAYTEKNFGKSSNFESCILWESALKLLYEINGLAYINI